MPMNPGSDELRRAARTLVVDATAASVYRAFQSAEVRAILLKGPVLAGWLYGRDEFRDYGDVDFLVSPEHRLRARDVLRQLGFELSLVEVPLPHGRQPHAETWMRPDGGVEIDLHRTLPGLQAPYEKVWLLLSARTETIESVGATLEIMNGPARAFLVALHAAHHGIKVTQTLEDLDRALLVVSPEDWRLAALLADDLEALEPFAAGLRLSPIGRAVAADLRMPAVESVEVALRASSAPELALSLDWLVRTRGLSPRARLVIRKLAPSPGVLKARSSLARRGWIGLLSAYAVRPIWLVWHGIPAFRAWRAARATRGNT